MESYPTIHKITIAQQSSALTVDTVVERLGSGVPQAANFGFQVSIFFFAVIMAIAFVQFLLNRD
jgi:hypothetical protein